MYEYEYQMQRQTTSNVLDKDRQSIFLLRLHKKNTKMTKTVFKVAISRDWSKIITAQSLV